MEEFKEEDVDEQYGHDKTRNGREEGEENADGEENMGLVSDN
jgi:hypothetical protein